MAEGLMQCLPCMFHTICNSMPLSFFFLFYSNNVDKPSKTSQTRPPQLVVLPVPSLYQSISRRTKVEPTRSDWEQTLLSLCCTKCLAPSDQPSLSDDWFGFLLRLMHDVSIDPLSQSRPKPLSPGPSVQHVLSIWTHPAYSRAAMLQRLSYFSLSNWTGSAGVCGYCSGLWLGFSFHALFAVWVPDYS